MGGLDFKFFEVMFKMAIDIYFIKGENIGWSLKTTLQQFQSQFPTKNLQTSHQKNEN